MNGYVTGRPIGSPASYTYVSPLKVYVSPPVAHRSNRHGANASNSTKNAASSLLARPFALEKNAESYSRRPSSSSA
jgi:hypothetical protein